MGQSSIQNIKRQKRRKVAAKSKATQDKEILKQTKKKERMEIFLSIIFILIALFLAVSIIYAGIKTITSTL